MDAGRVKRAMGRLIVIVSLLKLIFQEIQVA
jgi:hypothetical protein